MILRAFVRLLLTSRQLSMFTIDADYEETFRQDFFKEEQQLQQ